MGAESVHGRWVLETFSTSLEILPIDSLKGFEMATPYFRVWVNFSTKKLFGAFLCKCWVVKLFCRVSLSSYQNHGVNWYRWLCGGEDVAF